MTRPRSARRIALAALPLGAFAGAAAAQTTNSADAPSAAPVPTPAAPTIVLPTPTPAPSATPTPRASPTPRARPSATPTPRPSARPSAAPTPFATPSPTPVASPTPIVTPTPTPSATPTAPAGDDDLARTPAQAERIEDPRWWQAVFGIAALLVAAALGARYWLRRRAAERAQAEAERRPQVLVAGVPPEAAASGAAESDAPTFWTPSRPPAPPAAAPAAPAADLPAAPPSEAAPPPPAGRARLALALRPRRAGLNLVSATADVDLTVRNEGDAAAESVTVTLQLLAGRAGQDGELGALFGGEQGRPLVPPFALAPGEERVCRTTLVLPRAEIAPIAVKDRAMFVPVVAADVRHVRADGSVGQTAAGYVIGAVRSDGEKLSPFWLDAAPRMRDEVEARPHGLAVER